MGDLDLKGEQMHKAGRIVDLIVVDSDSPVKQPVPGQAGRLDVDPSCVDTRLAHPEMLTRKNVRLAPQGRFGHMPAILLLCVVILGLLYGVHLASVAFAELTTLQPMLGWVYAVVLGMITIVLATSVVRLVVQYRSLKNISGLQWMSRRASAQQPVDQEMARDAILDYLDDLQTRGDAQTKRSIEQLRVKFGQYRGEVARDFALFDGLVLQQIDRQVDSWISDCSLQVAVATALATRLFDPFIVGVQALRIVREIAMAYRGRPGLLGTVKLFVRALSAAIFAEAVELLADAASQLSGITAATKLGARLGEGLTNGFVMCRLGEATKRLCRPVLLPPADYSHSLSQLVRGLLFRARGESEEQVVHPAPM
jgi:uncharacterized membrane protein YcjF (UPF0283 family)